MKKHIKTSELHPSSIRHNKLSKELLERIKTFKHILNEVEKTSLAETIESFRRDTNPENEVIVWERIANTYRIYLAHNPTEDLAIKKDIFGVLLGASIGLQNRDNIRHLTQEQINHLLLNYCRFP